jgi:hypothetical protein
VAFPSIPNVRTPNGLTAGARTANRLIANDGAPGTALPLLVPQTDRDGNDLSGVRLPDVSVPLALVLLISHTITTTTKPRPNFLPRLNLPMTASGWNLTELK